MPVTYTGPVQYFVTTSSSTTSTAWADWNTQYIRNTQYIGTTYGAGTGTGTVTTVWPQWNEGYTAEQLAEQQERWRQRQAELRRQQDEANAARLVADGRAGQLLRSLLTPEQARSYEMRRCFEVTGSAGGRWRIRRDGQMGNVDLLDADGQLEATYCCHPPGGLPDADAHLAQLLQLVTDEEGFRRIGNVHWRRRTGLAAA